MERALSESDRGALKNLFEETGGREWTNSDGWLTDVLLRQWKGVETMNRGRVVGLSLGGNNLQGRIPDSVSSLTLLQTLWLWENKLTGSIPDSFSSLTALQDLQLWGNKLTGSIPDSLSSLTVLRTLHLSGNKLTGSIPDSFSSLTALQELQLRGNELTGNIPASLSCLTNLEWLNLSRNQLSGSIPASLSSLTRLEYLRLHNNQLSGSIPASLWSLSRLRHLFLNNNELSGEVPPGFTCLVNLVELKLSGNHIDSLPPKLEAKHFHRGEFRTGLGRRKQAKVLKSLYEKTGGRQWTASQGWLTDAPLERWYGVKTSFVGEVVGLHLSSNNLRGNIPDSLSSLTTLQYLYLSDNKLSGNIPDSLSSLTALEHLHLSDNKLSGQVPFSFTSLVNLRELTLSGNIVGPMPPELEPALGDGQRFWSEQMQRKRQRQGEKERSWARMAINWLCRQWHVILPILDDITDYLLLWTTFDSDQRGFWWTCLVALALADADRAHALVYLVVLVVTSVLGLLVSVADCFTLESDDSFSTFDLMWKPAEFLSGGHRHTSRNITRLFLDAATWTLLGPRSRYAHTGLGGETPVDGAQLAGSDLRIIDVFLMWHPYTLCGQLILSCPRGLRIPRSGRERSRRAMVMVKAVGETVVVDVLFLTLGLLTSSWDDPSLVALSSSVFSVLELMIELQYYINEAEPYLQDGTLLESDLPLRHHVHEMPEPQSRRDPTA